MERRKSVLLLLYALLALAVTGCTFAATATAHVLAPDFDFDYCGTVLHHRRWVDDPSGFPETREFSRQCHTALRRQAIIVTASTSVGLALTAALAAFAVRTHRRTAR